MKVRITVLCNQFGECGFARSRRSPENAAKQLPSGNRFLEKSAVSHEMVLSEELKEIYRSDPFREGRHEVTVRDHRWLI